MKNYINRHQKIKSICRVMNNYPQAFADKPKALALKDEFNQQSEEVSELISKLLRPASTIHRPKQDRQLKLTLALQEFIGMGILLASHLENMPLLDILKHYKKKLHHSAAYNLYEMASHVAEELGKQAQLGVEFGLTTEKLEAFNELVSSYGETLEQTGALLSDRKSGWNQLNNKILSCSKTIRLKIDPFILFNEKEFPEMYKEYVLVRGNRRKKKRVVNTDDTLGDISGVITDSVTGLPLANATINLVDQELAYTTDNDGYYLIDELEPQTYKVSCYAVGYDVPQAVTCELKEGESLLVDFSLVPVNPINN